MITKKLTRNPTLAGDAIGVPAFLQVGVIGPFFDSSLLQIGRIWKERKKFFGQISLKLIYRKYIDGCLSIPVSVVYRCALLI